MNGSDQCLTNRDENGHRFAEHGKNPAHGGQTSHMVWPVMGQTYREITSCSACSGVMCLMVRPVHEQIREMMGFTKFKTQNIQ